MMTDPIADMLTRIRNGQQAKLFSVQCPSSKFKISILDVLKREGYIANYKVSKDAKPVITIDLKYSDGLPVIKEIKRASKPGCRVFSKISAMKKFYNGLGIAILSTSKGVISDFEAAQKKVGGEIICYVF